MDESLRNSSNPRLRCNQQERMIGYFAFSVRLDRIPRSADAFEFGEGLRNADVLAITVTCTAWMDADLWKANIRGKLKNTHRFSDS